MKREFENLNELLSENKRLEKSYLSTVVNVGKVHLDLSRNTTNRAEIMKILNSKKDLLNQLCDDDETPVASKVNIDRRRFDPIKLGERRQKIRDEAMLEAIYDPKSRKEKKERDLERDQKSQKGLIRIYGYKHPKVMKFSALLLRCLKNCFEAKHDQLNLDMNAFLLLKNELSLSFLRNMDNIIATVKTAIKLYAS